jgi:hypothetical protein
MQELTFGGRWLDRWKCWLGGSLFLKEFNAFFDHVYLIKVHDFHLLGDVVSYWNLAEVVKNEGI